MPKNMARPNVGKLTLRTHLRPFLEKSGSRQIPAESPARFSQVSAEAAHDLNNALGSIRLCLDLLEAESDNAPKVRQHLKHIKPAVEHATDLTRHMLGLNAPAVSPGTETSLNTVLEGMGPMLSTLPRRDVALRLRLSPGLAPIAK